jgi:hypothetical protein
LASIRDITRTPNDHLAFSVGQHFCLGAHLARLELRVMFEELLKRLPDIDLDDDPELLRSHFIDGVKAMPVSYAPEVARRQARARAGFQCDANAEAALEFLLRNLAIHERQSRGACNT